MKICTAKQVFIIVVCCCICSILTLIISKQASFKRMMKNIVNEIKQYYYNQIYYHLPEDTHKKKLIYPCNYLTVNSGIALIDKNLFIPIQTFQFQTFQFLGYYDKKNDICFYKDEKYVYGNDLVFFSGFDYESLQILTGMIFDVEGNVYEKSCPGGLGCFKDNNAVYYFAGNCGNNVRNYTSDNSNLKEAGCLFIRNTDKTFPPESNYDNIRNS